MLRSLVGSEMCIRDRVSTQSTGFSRPSSMARLLLGTLALLVSAHLAVAAGSESIAASSEELVAGSRRLFDHQDFEGGGEGSEEEEEMEGNPPGGFGPGGGIPVPCTVGDWTDYSECSAQCGGGTQTRTRTVVDPGAGACPELSESRKCNTQGCEAAEEEVQDDVSQCQARKFSAGPDNKWDTRDKAAQGCTDGGCERLCTRAEVEAPDETGSSAGWTSDGRGYKGENGWVDWTEDQPESSGAWCCGTDTAAKAAAERKEVPLCNKDVTCSGNGECTDGGLCSCAEGFSGDDCSQFTSVDNMEGANDVHAAIRLVKLATAKQRLQRLNAQAVRATGKDDEARAAAIRAEAALKTASDALEADGGLRDKRADATREQEVASAAKTRAEVALDHGQKKATEARDGLKANGEMAEQAKVQLQSAQELEQAAALKKQAAQQAEREAQEAGQDAIQASSDSNAARARADEADKMVVESKAAVDCGVAGSTCKILEARQDKAKDAATAEEISSAAAAESRARAEGDLLTEATASQEKHNAMSVQLVKMEGALDVAVHQHKLAGEQQEAIGAELKTDTALLKELKHKQTAAEENLDAAQNQYAVAVNQQKLADSERADDLAAMKAAETASEKGKTRLAADEKAESEARAKLSKASVQYDGTLSGIARAEKELKLTKSEHKDAETALQTAKAQGTRDAAAAASRLQIAEQSLEHAEAEASKKQVPVQQAQETRDSAKDAHDGADKAHKAAHSAAEDAAAQVEQARDKAQAAGMSLDSQKNVLGILQGQMADMNQLAKTLSTDLADSQARLKSATADLTRSKKAQASAASSVADMEQSDEITALRTAQKKLDDIQALVSRLSDLKSAAEKQVGGAQVKLTASQQQVAQAEAVAAQADLDARNALPKVKVAASKVFAAEKTATRLAKATSEADVKITKVTHDEEHQKSALNKAQATLVSDTKQEKAAQDTRDEAIAKLHQVGKQLEQAGVTERTAELNLGKAKAEEALADENKKEEQKEVDDTRATANHAAEVARSQDAVVTSSENNAADKLGLFKGSQSQVKEAAHDIARQKEHIAELQASYVSQQKKVSSLIDRVHGLERAQKKAHAEYAEAAQAKTDAETEVDDAQAKQTKASEEYRVAANLASEKRSQAMAAQDRATSGVEETDRLRGRSKEGFEQLRSTSAALRTAIVQEAKAEQQRSLDAAKEQAKEIGAKAQDQVVSIHEASKKANDDLISQYDAHMAEAKRLQQKVDSDQRTSDFVSGRIDAARKHAAVIVSQAESDAAQIRQEASATANAQQAAHVDAESDKMAQNILQKAQAEVTAEQVPSLLLQLEAGDPVTAREAMERSKAAVQGSPALVIKAANRAEQLQTDALRARADAALAEQEETSAAKALATANAELSGAQRSAGAPRARFKNAGAALRSLVEEVAAGHAERQSAEAAVVHTNSELRAAKKHLERSELKLQQLRLASGEAKDVVESAVSAAKAADQQAKGLKAVAQDAQKAVEQVLRKNSAPLEAAQKAYAVRRDAEVQFGAAQATVKGLENSLSGATRQVDKANANVEERTAAVTADADKVDSEQTQVENSGAQIEAAKQQHQVLAQDADASKKVVTAAENAAAEAKDSWKALGDKAVARQADLPKLREASEKDRVAADTASSQLEEAIAKLVAASKQVGPAREVVDKAVDSSLNERAQLSKRQVALESVTSKVQAVKTEISDAQESIKALQDAQQTNSQAGLDSKDKAEAQTVKVSSAQSAEALAQEHVQKLMKEATEADSAAAKKKSVVDIWSKRLGHSESGLESAIKRSAQAKTDEMAAQTAVDAAKDAVEAQKVERADLLAMPQQRVKSTQEAVRQAEANLRDAQSKEQQDAAAKESAQQDVDSAVRTLRDTKKLIETDRSSGEPASFQEYQDATDKARDAKRELDAASAANTQVVAQLTPLSTKIDQLKQQAIDVNTGLVDLASAKSKAKVELDRVRESQAKLEQAYEQHRTALDEATQDAQSKSTKAAAKLKELTEATDKVKQAEIEHAAKTSTAAKDQERATALEDEAKALENQAAAKQNEATAAGNSHLSANAAVTAAEQAATAAMEEARKLEGSAAANKQALEDKYDKAVAALQPLQEASSAAHDAAISSGDSLQRVDTDYQLAEQTRNFAKLTKDRAGLALQQVQSVKKTALEEVKAADLAVREIEGSGVVELNE
eukprot:TRINITY_DN2893_c0_g3_i1.p1 TRINITY_DN2893_c0_g3~~TRINITY_DN2893_c0_g3_i1.p1  ORF type:complete len:2208 (-),score=765.20 TRINITY_DN2893_c0_g3_i1:85-6663(-)